LKKPRSLMQQGGVTDYSSRTGVIRGFLKQMLNEANADFDQTVTDLENEKKNYNERSADLTDKLETAEDKKISSDKAFSKSQAAQAAAEEDRATAEKRMAEANALLEKAAKDVQERSEAHAAASYSRVTEYNSIMKGIDLLKKSEKASLGESTKLLQEGIAGMSFIQFKDPVAAAQHMLLKTGSARLMLVAAHMKKTGGDGGYFEQIINEINKMIESLKAEAKQDDTDKDLCQRNAAANAADAARIKRDKEAADAEMKAMEAENDQLNDKMKESKKATEDANTEFKKLQEDTEEVTTNFKRDRKRALEQIKFLNKAIKELKSTYGLLQEDPKAKYTVDSDKAPSKDSNAGKRNAAGSPIIKLLQMVRNKAAQTMKKSLADYKKAMAAFGDNRAANDAMLDSLTEEQNSINGQIGDNNDTKDSASKDLDSAKQQGESNDDTKEAHKGNCDWLKTNYDERKTHRNAEINGLEEARNFLSGMKK